MPGRPNVFFDILCVLHSAADILSRAAELQAQQSLPAAFRSQSRTRREELHSKNTSNTEAPFVDPIVETTEELTAASPEMIINQPPNRTADLQPHLRRDSPPPTEPPSQPRLETTRPSRSFSPSPTPPTSRPIPIPSKPPSTEPKSLEKDDVEPAVVLKASTVPSSRLGRLFHYGSLAAGLSAGAASEMFRRSTGSSDGNNSSLILSEGNVARLVDKLSKMRGAALKLGQFMSIQDSHVLPEQLDKVLRQVQNSAHYMPNWQMEKVMSSELGPEWKSNFAAFEPIPFASASIGQVHRATLSQSIAPNSPFRDVAVKVQFPNVKSSIHSDLRNLSLLLHTSSLLPRGLFLDRTLATMEEELEDECDYLYEADAARQFKGFLEGDDRFDVMSVVDELTTSNVLTMQRMEGVPIVRAVNWNQEKRDEIAKNILTLCLRELFHFRFMQTDPNWSNFLYNQNTNRIELIDFGASRKYSKAFMDDWYMLLKAATLGDRIGCQEYSLKLGYLTGEEKEEMLNAHVQSLILLGQPFGSQTQQPFSFADQKVTSQIRDLIPVMLKNRLTPPPPETYSLNRKLSGAFLLCGKLKANVDCRAVWEEVTEGYQVGTEPS